jgi:hypothetical protein
MPRVEAGAMCAGEISYSAIGRTAFVAVAREARQGALRNP